MEPTDRQKSLLTLLTDKINRHGLMMGAHHNKNWINTPTYEHSSDFPRMQGTLDRIARVEYYQSFHVDEEKHCAFTNPCYLGSDLYNHSIRCYWKEPFGEGYGTDPSECLISSMTQDEKGRWHMPCDLGIWISVWHPNKQKFQEALYGCWDLHPAPHWRPIYNYTKEEVIEALQIMCETFNWEFKDAGKTETLIFR